MGMIGHLLRVTQEELDAFLHESDLLEKKIYRDAKANLIDLDKSWDGILFLLTGRGIASVDLQNPLTGIFLSGQIIDEEQDLGYGPAHYLRPDQVKEVDESISSISLAELKARFDPEKMLALGVYPTVWDRAGEEEYLTDYFSDLQAFYAAAASQGQATIFYVS